MEYRVKCRWLPTKARRNAHPRLIFTGGQWDYWDIHFCVHGHRLDSPCTDCLNEAHLFLKESTLGTSPSQDTKTKG